MNMRPHSPRNLRQLALLGLCLLATATSLIAGAPAKAGDPFPSLEGQGLAGSLPDLKGKVVLVDFWASWCGPCKKSFPVMKELHDTYGPKGFVILAISLDEQKAAMDAFVKKATPPFAILHDSKGKIAELLAVDKMPTSYLVGADGKILSVHSGFEGDATKKEYVKEIESALKAR